MIVRLKACHDTWVAERIVVDDLDPMHDHAGIVRVFRDLVRSIDTLRYAKARRNRVGREKISANVGLEIGGEARLSPWLWTNSFKGG